MLHAVSRQITGINDGIGGNWLIQIDDDEVGASPRTDDAAIAAGGPLFAVQDMITGAFSLRNETRKSCMSVRKATNPPQRSGSDTSQAGCRGFESRPPLQKNRITK